MATSIILTDRYTKNSLKNQAVDANQRLIVEGRENMLNYLSTIEKSTFTLYSNSTIESILDRGWSDYQSESSIMTAMHLVSQSADGIHQVYMSVDNSQRAYLLQQDTFTRGGIERDYLPARVFDPYHAYIEPTHPSHYFGLHPVIGMPNQQVITLHRPLNLVPSGRQLGMISVDIRIDAIRKLMGRLVVQDKEDLFILDQEGTVIYATDDPERIGRRLEETWVQQIVDDEDRLGNLELNSTDFAGIVVYDKIQSPWLDWTIAKRVPNSTLYAQARQLAWINTGVAIAFLFVVVIAVVIVSYRITKPIKELIRWSNAIQAGKLEETININRVDEIGSLARKFQNMMHTINELILQEYKLNLANKTNELKALQAQINPHFIYNALQSIGALALEHKSPKIYMLLMSMGQIMHYSMNAKETTVALGQEIEHVEHYLALQKQRFEGELDYRLEVEEQAATVIIPKMVVQPIVENYFKHGMAESPRNGYLSVHASLRENWVFIAVEDNGPGVPDGQLELLQGELARVQNSAVDREDNIGLINVIRRLRLYHGNEAELILSNRVEGGVRALLKIPAKHSISST